MTIKTYKGYLRESYWGGADDILFLFPSKSAEGADLSPLSEILEEDLEGKQVSVRYYVCNRKCSLVEAQKSHLAMLAGLVDANVGARYSEVTGYLWTDEEVKIGGHGLIEELHSHVGKWLILIVDIHDSKPTKDGIGAKYVVSAKPAKRRTGGRHSSLGSARL